MKKKKKKVKHKIKLIPFLVLLLIISIIAVIIFFSSHFKIQNIFISGNVHLSDEYIIEYLGLSKYPSYVSNLPEILEYKLKKNSYIKDCDIKGKFFGVLLINVTENKVLFYKTYDDKYVLESLEEVGELPYNYVSTRVINYIPDTVYSSFLNNYKKLDKTVIDKISEIKYDPTPYDEERFLFYMIDGNYVYVTTTKLDSINYYNEIYPTLEGRKGTLFLDSGNHFQAF